MDNIKLLYSHNPGTAYNYKLSKDKKMIFTFTENVLDGNTIGRIIHSISTYKKQYPNFKIPVIFHFSAPEVIIADKLSYILLECLCYSMLNDYLTPVQIAWNPSIDILTQGINSSPLLLLNSNNQKNILDFSRKFKMDIYKNHYRKLISGQTMKETNYLGRLYEEIDSFLKFFDISDEYRDSISEVIAELIGNACEHGDSDCLLDIDITTDYAKTEFGQTISGSYYGINIAIINFSEILIGDALKHKVYDCNPMIDRYVDVQRALEYHKNRFSDNYDETDFFNISVFQDKISGRCQYSKSGGTGLSLLIKSLQDKSDSNKCFMISGDRAIFFYNTLLEYDSENWLGFNETHSYLSDIPSPATIGDCFIHMPGTGYNLNFIMKREDVSHE